MNIRFRPIEKWPREMTVAALRKRSPFSADLRKTYQDLNYELWKLEAQGDIVIQLAVRDREIRQDGAFRADAKPPEHPGVIVKFDAYIDGRKTPLSFACDDCREWKDNLRAIVKTLEHLRGADRYGVTKSGEQYRGWNALPPAMAMSMSVEEAARKLAKMAAFDLPDSDIEVVADKSIFRDAWRSAADRYHPDHNNGDVLQEWHTLQDVKSVLERHHGL